MAHTPLPQAYIAAPSARPRRLANFVAAVLALVWFGVARDLAGRSATGLLGRVSGGLLVPLFASLFLLFLLLVGFVLLERVTGRRSSVREILSLPDRPTAGREWALGAAVGWGIAVLAVLPMALAGTLYIQTWLQSRGWLSALMSVATAAVVTLAGELVFRGYAFRTLATSITKTLATIVLSAWWAFVATREIGTAPAFLIAFLFGLLLTTAWLRTHALWLSWGLSFAWTAAVGILFGLPVANGTELAGIFQTQAQGGTILTGAGFGPAAAPWSVVVLLLATVVLFRVTRDLAWRYTHPPIVAAGYPMDVAPPPAHTAMEAAAAPPPPLVQILPSTPQEGSRGGPLP